MPTEFHYNQLDPVQFQRLINAILIARFGEPLRLLPLRGKDGGRDAELPRVSVFDLKGRRKVPGTTQRLTGEAIFQVKHHRTLDGPLQASRTAVVSDFDREVRETVLSQPAETRAKSFFLITNVPASKEAFDRIDQKRKELLKGSDIHADVLWGEHLTAWLDQYPRIWFSFPDLFAGRIVPQIASIANETAEGVSRAFRIALKTQFSRDATVRFRQVDLEQKLTDLFVNLEGQPVDLTREEAYELGTNISSRGGLTRDIESFEHERHPWLRNSINCMALLTSEGIAKDGKTTFQKYLIEGGPGQGKSTLSQMLAQVYRSVLLGNSADYESFHYPEKARLPFRVELRLFAEWMNSGGDSIEQFIVHSLSKEAGGATITVNDWHALIDGEPVLLIFDGLDEVGGDEPIDAVLKKIGECIDRVESLDPTAKVIVTTRPPAIAGKAARLPGFTNIRILPLNPEQVKQYVHKWTTCVISESEDRERVTQSFNKRSNEVHVKALATNPMQLSVLLHFIRMSGEAFPDKRAELYRDYFKIVIDRDVEKTPRLRTMRRDIEALHELIGFKLHTSADSENARGSASIDRPKLIAFVKEWLLEEQRNISIDADDLFRLGEDRLGLIVALKGEGGKTSYGFEIQPVREYFAASYINQRAAVDANEFFQEMIRRPFWREVGLFLAGLRRDNERADLLLRAKELDRDNEFGWRQDGRTTVLELLQEGVLASPGHVQRDSVSFVLELIDPTNGRPRNEPDSLIDAIAPIARACAARVHIDQLDRYLEDGRLIRDIGAMWRVYQIAGRVLDKDKFRAHLQGLPGEPTELSALTHIAWPDSNRTDLVELSKGDFWPKQATHHWASVWFDAVAASPEKAALKAEPSYHQLLLEQFAFCSVIRSTLSIGRIPYIGAPNSLQAPDSPWAVWRLCNNLRALFLMYIGQERSPIQLPLYDTAADLSGLSPELAATVGELTEASNQALSATASKKDSQKIERFMDRISDHLQAEGIAGWIACRCALTLLEAVVIGQRYIFREGRVMEQDGIIRYVSMRPSRAKSRLARLFAWNIMRSQLALFYQNNYFVDRGKGKKTNPNRIVERGVSNICPDQIVVDGKFVAVTDLLADPYRSGTQNSASLGPLLRHIPIPRSWFRPLVEQSSESIEAILSRITENHTFDGPPRPLTASSMQKLCAIARRSENPNVLSGVLSVLIDSKFLGFMHDDTLDKLIVVDGTHADVAPRLFQDTGGSANNNPRLRALAERIISGKLSVSREMGIAAAKYSAKNISPKFEPLRSLLDKQRVRTQAQ